MNRRASGLFASVMLCVVGGFATRAAAAAPGALQAHLTTNKGCLETGDDARFAVGEKLVTFLGASSSTFNQASLTLYSIKQPGFVTSFVFGSLVTNVSYGFGAKVGLPHGVHQLKLKASAGGSIRWRTCSFKVVGTHTPGPTASVTPTKTPKPTRTATVAKTPSTALVPRVTTNRGCKETGDDPKFFIGELVTISYGIDSDAAAFAQATLFDILPNGFVTVLRNRIVETNQTFSFKATVAPPTGMEVLKLRASAYGFHTVGRTCSFTVVSGPPPSRTRTGTRTPTATPTQTPPPP